MWGVAVVADSAQFSAAASELAHPRYMGIALAVQTSMGFLLTIATILAVPPLLDRVGWRWVFPILAIGPGVGVASLVQFAPLARVFEDGRREALGAAPCTQKP